MTKLKKNVTIKSQNVDEVRKIKMRYVKPEIILLTGEELNEHIKISASCKNALCGAEGTYTCGTTVNYNCSNYSGDVKISCPSTYSFGCTKGHVHADSVTPEVDEKA